MSAIDYTYRFDPENPSARVMPNDAEGACRILEDGNRKYSRWMESRRVATVSDGEQQFIVPCSQIEVGLTPTKMAKQAPFAIVVGCSDARVPAEILFGQSFNDLFVVRVAGNILGDVCMGSIDYALNALNRSIRVIVVLGHSGCGAVTGAVDAYLCPTKFWSPAITPMVRTIIEPIFVAVCESAQAFDKVWGPDAQEMPGYRAALTESAVCLNAAQSAFSLRKAIECSGQRDIDVRFSVYNIRNHTVCPSVDPKAARSDKNVRLAPAPRNPEEFGELAIQMAELLKPGAIV